MVRLKFITDIEEQYDKKLGFESKLELEKKELRDLVLQCTVRRLSCNESVGFVAQRLVDDKAISIRHIERVKQQIKQESTKWVYSYAKDHDLYVSECSTHVLILTNHQELRDALMTPRTSSHGGLG